MSHDAPHSAGVREGDILAGKYRIDRVLGVGGMGVVVAAHHLHLDERVAIKFMLPDALSNKEAVARFAREARAAVKIKSEHVARVTDVGTLENGAPYMVMEYLDGSDLAGWVESMGRLPVEQAVDFVIQACVAIAEAHSIGIVHRDLKPANLFVIRRPDGSLSVKVLDFGISKMASGGASGSDMTRTSAMMGSPLYMSPEQMQSARDADARSDIWALGVILFELLTGSTPFTGESMPELVLRVVSTPAPAPRSLRPDLPEALDAAILRCLEKDRGARFQSVAELAVALLPFGPKRARAAVESISGMLRVSGLGLTATPESSDRAAVATTGGTQATWGRTGTALGRDRTVAATVAGVLVLAAGALAFVRMRSGGEPGPAAEPSAVAASIVAPAPTQPVPVVPSAPEPNATAAPVVPPPTAASASANVTPAPPATPPPPTRPSSPRATGGRAPSPRVPPATRPAPAPAPSPVAAPPPPKPAAAPAPPPPAKTTSAYDDRK